KINPDGTVALNTGAAEIGSGALPGAAQGLAEELGIDLSDINVVSADTFSTPFDFRAPGSRAAFAGGNRCRAAAAQLKGPIFARDAAQLGAEPDALTLVDKHVVAPGKRLSLADLARLSQQTGGGLIAHGTFIAPSTPYDTKRVEGMSTRPSTRPASTRMRWTSRWITRRVRSPSTSMWSLRTWALP